MALPNQQVNGTLVKDHGHGGHGEHDVALESMLPISCALILAFAPGKQDVCTEVRRETGREGWVSAADGIDD